MSAIASFSTVAVAAPTTASRSNVAKRYVCIFIRRETETSDVASRRVASVASPRERTSVAVDGSIGWETIDSIDFENGVCDGL